MMKKYTFILFLSLVVGCLSAQLTNSGGTIVIEPGAILIVNGDIDNLTGSSITNSGTIEVEGNLTNAATFTSSALTSEVIFKGTGNSNFTSGGAVFTNVRNQKTSGDVVLLDNLQVSESVDFVGTSNIVLGANSVTLEDATTTNGSSSTGWFVTNGTGEVVKKINATATTTFDVGDAASFTPIAVAHSGTYMAGTSTVSAKVTPSVHPNIPANADDFISRYWTVNNSNITGYSANMTGTFDDVVDVTGVLANVKGARYESGAWEYTTGSSTPTTVSATSTAMSSDLTGTNFFGKANITVFLEGPYNNAGAMTNGINAFLPLASPYDSKVAPSIPANAVDWIQVEIRDNAAQNIVESAQSGFLLTDGSIVEPDGTPLLLKNAKNTSHIAIKHRNHLGIMSAAPLSLATSVPTVNFADGTTSVYSNGPDAMYTESDGKFTLFGADGNNSGNVSASDFVLVFKPANGQPFDYYTTGRADFNLNGSISATDFVLIFKKNNSKLQQIPQ